MMAVWSPRLSRWRSMQFQATLRTPSSNHLIEILPGAKEGFSTLVKGLIQPLRSACSPRHASLSLTERAYISWYLAWSTQARFDHSAGTSYILSDIPDPPPLRPVNADT